MEEILKNGSLLAAVCALAFIIVGLLQWAVGLAKTSDKRHAELIEELSKEKLENARLQGQLILYSDKMRDMNERLQDYKRRYLHYKALCEALQTGRNDDDDSPPRPAPNQGDA